jgi:hypothetical protein
MPELNIGTDKKTNKKISLPLESLKKHAAVFGGSGSGKTVLCKVIVEEAVKQDIPCILVDPQGDLASFALNTELKTVIFTPASSKGISICLNPLKQMPKDLEQEEVINVIHQISSSITALLGYKDDDTGKGAQSLLYYVILDAYEKETEIGNFENLAITIKNLSEDVKEKTKELVSEKEISNIIRKISYLNVGEKELLFNFGVTLDIKTFLEPGQISVIYLNTLHSEVEKQFFVSSLATELYQYMLTNPSDKVQLIFYIDEISSYIPAGMKKPISKPILKLVYKQARKYGIGCLVATQNPGDIDYTAFSQFSTWAIGRLTTKQDRAKIIDALKSVAGQEASEINDKLPSLKPGEFALFSPDNFDKVIDLKVRQLVSPHKTLNDDDVKNATSAETRKHFEKMFAKKTGFENIHSGKEKEKEIGLKHIKINITQQQVNEIVEKNKKKLFIIAGPQKENIESMQLIFEPLYKTRIKTIKKGLFAKKFKEHYALFSALTGNQLSKDLKEYEGINHILGIGENETIVLKILSNAGKEMTSNDIVSKTNLSSNSVNSALTNLSKKRLVTKSGKTGTSNLWNSLVKLDIPSLDKLSFSLEFSEQKVEAKPLKTKISEQEISKAVNHWYGSTEIINSEIVYLPVYETIFVSKNKKRCLRINAFNGKVSSADK